jgi:hypothetical protein
LQTLQGFGGQFAYFTGGLLAGSAYFTGDFGAGLPTFRRIDTQKKYLVSVLLDTQKIPIVPIFDLQKYRYR